MKSLNIMVAVDSKGGFGKDGKIPWHFAEDFKHFQKVTSGSICIMGRKTYEDMLGYAKKRRKTNEKFNKRLKNTGPPGGTEDRRGNGIILLKNRECIVLSSTLRVAEGAVVFKTLRDAVEHYEGNGDSREIFALGGQAVYKEALSWCDIIHMTVIKGEYSCDRFFPTEHLKNFKVVKGQETEDLYFTEWRRRG